MSIKLKTQRVTLTNLDGETRTHTLNIDSLSQPAQNRWGYGAFLGRYILPLRDVYLETSNKSANVIRDGSSLDERHIDRLMASMMSYGFKDDELPPVVVPYNEIVDGVLYKYRVKNAGAHRGESLTRLDASHWIFDLYNFDGDRWAETDFGLKDNNHTPALSTTRATLAKNIERMLDGGRWEHIKGQKELEKVLHKYLTEVADLTHKSTRTSIITDVLEANPKYTDIVKYTSKTASEWVEQNTDFKQEGKYDSNLDACGWVVGAGYLHEKVWKAIRKFANENRKSYFVNHTVVPKGDDTLDSLRDQERKDLTKYEEELDKLFEYKQKHGKYPWWIHAFLPQDRGANDSIGEDLDQPILEKDVPTSSSTAKLDKFLEIDKAA